MREPILLWELPGAEIVIDRKEALRYLGYGAQMPSAEVLRLLEEEEEILRQAMACRACFTQVAIERREGQILLGELAADSRALWKNLASCEQAFLFAATLGSGVDRAIARAERRSSAAGVVMDALASAAIESVCDRLCAELASGTAGVEPRFSPGYGDLPLSFQRELMARLDASRRIGLTLTDSMMMAPTKSVTAIMGIYPQRACTCPSCD